MKCSFVELTDKEAACTSQHYVPCRLSSGSVPIHQESLQQPLEFCLGEGTDKHFLFLQRTELIQTLLNRKLLPANATNQQLSGSRMQMKKSLCIPISGYLVITHSVLPIVCPLPSQLELLSASKASHVLVALQNINSLLIKDYLNPRKLLKYASVLLI